MGDDDWEVRQVISEVLLSAHDYAQFINPRKSLDAAGLPVYKCHGNGLPPVFLN